LSKNLKDEFISYADESHSEHDDDDTSPQHVLEAWFKRLRQQNTDEEII
jgi:hypothetical protein